MQRRSSKKMKGAKPRGGSDRRGQLIPRPPQLPSYGITRDVRLRFVSNASVLAQVITYQNLLDVCLVAATAVLGYDLFDAVKIRAFEFWVASVTGAPETISATFNGETVGAQGDAKTHTDTSMGIEPAHVKMRPDPRSQAAQFQTSSTDTAIVFTMPSGTVIDVSVTLRQPVLGQAVAAQNALVGATPGAVYYRGLDGKAVATTVFPVQGSFFI